MTEIDATPDVNKASDAAKAALTRETFDFAAAVQGRSYPEFDVPVYLNEKSIQKLLAADREREELETRIALTPKPTVKQAKELDALQTARETIVDELRAERYLVKIKGISTEVAVGLEDKTFEEFPREYDESTHHLTGATVRTEKPNSEREELFASLLRQAHIVSVTAPNGAIDDDFSDLEKIKATWARLPFVARVKVDQAIQEATISTDFYNELADEVF